MALFTGTAEAPKATLPGVVCVALSREQGATVLLIIARDTALLGHSLIQGTVYIQQCQQFVCKLLLPALTVPSSYSLFQANWCTTACMFALIHKLLASASPSLIALVFFSSLGSLLLDSASKKLRLPALHCPWQRQTYAVGMCSTVFSSVSSS